MPPVLAPLALHPPSLGVGLNLICAAAPIRPQATPFERMQWTVLNSAISLTGYWCAAALVDKPWYGRRRMQVRRCPRGVLKHREGAGGAAGCVDTV